MLIPFAIPFHQGLLFRQFSVRCDRDPVITAFQGIFLTWAYSSYSFFFQMYYGAVSYNEIILFVCKANQIDL